MNFTELIKELTVGFTSFGWGNGVMILVGCILLYLAIVKEYEPTLLMPIGFGCILANLGMSKRRRVHEGDLRRRHYDRVVPLLIFVGVGAMIDFRPLMAHAANGAVRPPPASLAFTLR